MYQFKLIHEIFEYSSNANPDLIAVVFGEKSITYSDLNKKADQLARIIAKDRKDEGIIGVSTTRGIEMIIGVIAVLKAGKAYLPLDPFYPEERKKAMIATSGIKTCVSGDDEYGLFLNLGLQLISSGQDHTPIDINEKSIQTGPLASILFTSGSTGTPKGVILEHQGLVEMIQWQMDHSRATKGMKTLQFCHLGFDVSIQEIFVTLCTGGELHLIENLQRLDANHLLNYISEKGINRVFFPFVALQYFTEAAISNAAFPACLLEIITGGELLKITPQINTFFRNMPQCILKNIYGPTEASIWVTEIDLHPQSPYWSDIPPIGKPIADCKLFVLDEDLKPCGYGTVGGLYLGGASLAKGYLNREDLTKERFLDWKSPDGSTLRIYKTGDLALKDSDGQYYFKGRIDDQVKIRGNRVELGEIEIALGKIQGVSQAVVKLIEDSSHQKMLVAYLLFSNQQSSLSKIKKDLRDLLPDYMIPDFFLEVKDFPKTSSGKIDKLKLPDPTNERPESGMIYIPPSTQMEKNLAKIFKHVLNYDSVGINDNFFEMGGNSLRAQKAVAELFHEFSYSVPIIKLYQYPTISGLNEFLTDNQKKSFQISKSRMDSNADIAVIGMEGRFPGAENLDELWEILSQGKETIQAFDESEIDPSISKGIRENPLYVRARGIIKDYDKFDNSFFGINPKLASIMDPQQRIFLEIAHEVLEKSGYNPSEFDGLIGVFAGISNNTYFINNVIPNNSILESFQDFQISSLNEKDYIATRTAYHLNLKGPAVSVHSGCSTTLLAIAQSVESLRSGKCDIALAGGASIKSPVFGGHLYEEGSVLSGDGHVNSFDKSANGTIFSDGAGVVLLKRLDQAKKDGDKIFAVIKGIGVNNDGGEKGSFTAPSSSGQAGAIGSALADGNIDPNTVTYVEAHGTATPIGDPIEIEGLKLAFGDTLTNEYCALGTIKSNVGHLNAVAGVAGFIKTVLCLHHKKLVPQCRFVEPNPSIDFKNSPFFINTQLKKWDYDKGARRAGVSSFGVGGTNVHIILEEGEDNIPLSSSPDTSPGHLIPWSAKSEESLIGYAEKLKDYVESNSHIELANFAHSLQKKKPEYAFRAFLTISSKEELLKKLTAVEALQNATKLSAAYSNTVFLFPGQGSQYINMGRSLFECQPVFREAILECARLLKPILDRDILDIIFSESLEEESVILLKNTKYTQPAIFITAYAMAKLWASLGIKPNLLCGHSIGEFVAAHFAGIMSLKDALKLVANRGQLVSSLPPGSMLSIRMEEAELKKILPDSISIAAINSKNSCVVAGKESDILAFSEKLKKMDIVAGLLKTSHAFHSYMMDPILEKFHQLVSDVKLSRPKIPILSTVTGDFLKDEEAIDPNYWTNHLRKSVRFSDAVLKLFSQSQSVFIEVGPGNVLSSLSKQHPGANEHAIFNSIIVRPNKTEYENFLQSVGEMWSIGKNINWDGIYPEKRLTVPLPTYAFKKQRFWIDPVPLKSLNGYKTVIPESESFVKEERDQVLSPISRKIELEQKIQKVLSDTTGFSIASTTSSFIEMGLDSLFLTQFAGKLKKEFKINVTFRQLNESLNTVDSLAEYLDENLPKNNPPKQRENGVGQIPIKNYAKHQNNYHIDSIPSSPKEDPLDLISKQLQILTEEIKQLKLLSANENHSSGKDNGYVASDASLELGKPFEEQDYDPNDGFELEKEVDSIFPQQEIWVSCAIGGNESNCSYNQSTSLHLKGELNAAILEFALKEVIKRHEALRSTFSVDGKILRIHKNINVPLVLEDISLFSENDRLDFISRFLSKDASSPFDLINGPLIRASLIKVLENEHILILNAHHIICDGWSIGVIFEELAQIYSSLVKGGSYSLETPYSFSQYARYFKDFTSNLKYLKIEKYWLNQFQGEVPVLDLPTDWPRPEFRTFKSLRADFTLNPELVKAIKNIGVQYNASLVSTLMAAFEIFLNKITGQKDIVLGLPAAGQAATGNFDLIGHCVNLLPVRSQLDGELSFIEYLDKRRKELMNDYDHQQYTFGSLLQKLNIKRDTSRVPLVPVVFNIDMGMDSSFSFYELTHYLKSNPRIFENFEIFLNITDSDGKLSFEWSYNTRLFKPETIQGMMKGYESILTSITNWPETKIKNLSVIDSNRFIKKLNNWNDTFFEFSRDTPFTRLIQKMALQFPQKTAISFGERTLSYQDLEAYSNQFAHLLIHKEVGPGDIVGVALDRTPEMIVALLGIIKTGAAYLPLDPEYPKDRIEFMLTDSEAKILLTTKRLKGNFSSSATELLFEESWVKLQSFPSTYPDIQENGNNLAYILYTSGSTGNPKGVQIEHHSLMNFLLSMQKMPGICQDDKLLAITTISFDIAGLELYLPLISGAEIVLANAESSRDGRVLLKMIKEKEITFMQATPATWRMLFNVGWHEPYPIKALCGGEALPKDLTEKLLTCCDTVFNVYGPTETTIWSTVKHIQGKDEPLTIGRPIQNTQIYIVDEDLNIVPEATVGEILIGGEGVARGYHQRLELTQEKFVTNPFSTNHTSKLYRTGDVGKYLSNGEIICLGRIDHQVKIRGHRIELGEIEFALGKIPGIKETAVLALEDSLGNKRLAAYLLLTDTETQNEEDFYSPSKTMVSEWKKYLQEVLPNYMIPNDWLILKRFPLTSNNKIDRKAFPKPAAIQHDVEDLSEKSLSEKQEIVADIWKTSLKLSKIGLNEDFFELGGHSILAVEVMARIEEKTGEKLPLTSLFKYSTLEAFLKLFNQEAQKENWNSLVPIKPVGNKPPIYLVHAAGSHISTYYLLAKKLDPEQPVYGLQAKGLNGIDKPLTTLEEIAAHYLSEIFEHNPNGPYNIAGHSFGGYVAYEMARQLKQMNKKVNKLILFDIYAYQSETPLTPWQKLQRKINNELEKRIVDTKLLFNAPETLIALKKSSMEKKKKKLLKFFHLGGDSAEFESFRIIEKIRKINHTAMDNYLLSPYDGDVHLFKAKIQNFFAKDKVNYGWRPYVNNVHLVEIAGDHNSMFQEPIVDDLGTKLQAVLDQPLKLPLKKDLKILTK